MIRIWAMAAAIAAALVATTAEARWLRAETDSFIIYSEGSDKSLREFASTLQRFDVALRILLDVKDRGETNRLPIYLLVSTGEVAKLYTGSRESSFVGFYRTGREGSFAVSHRENGGRSRGTSASQETLFHEYAHHFMKRYRTGAFPAWIIEGFAEYYSTVDFNKDGKALIGKPAYGRGYGLVQLPQIPVEVLLNTDPNSLKTTGQVDVYYGRAWLLTHMLFHNPEREGQLSAYVRAINAGVEAREAARVAFGDLKQLDRDLAIYLRRPLSYRETRDAIPLPTQVSVTALSPGEDAVIPLRLARLNSRGEDGSPIRDSLRALTATHANDAAVWFEYAAAEWALDEEVRDLATVRSAVDRALAIKPDHVRANVLLGELRMHELEKKGDYEDTSWRTAREPIALANRTDPDDPLPLYLYFQSFLAQGKSPPVIAIEGLERAFQLAPENIEMRVAYAFALANRGQFTSAIKLAQSIAFDPHIGAQARPFLEQLLRMRQERQGMAPLVATESPDQ
ncbi:hypothetical protein SAMN05428974_2165 [Sphingopyxis sp. YR583]|uniref:hypothetical protein n=1 Tax=Sphingopyxis sp. YR583 TaxID=1881047 RepID=UPI0008A72EDA|nr:hypothetical protein [Sphingopyxis sp. YR583]SEH17332.1 hypothetical protein SAMN05428974_2165 [Sphingopyxis sp. YR583]